MTEAKRTKRAKPDPELVKLADSLLANYQTPEDLIGENGLLKQLTKMLVERALADPADSRLYGVERGEHQVTPRSIRHHGVDRVALSFSRVRADDLEVDRLRLPAARCRSPWP